VTRRLTVLSVAYPFAPVGPGAVGGAEQVLSMIDEALVEAGHRSVVVACDGSTCAGELVAIPAARGPLDDDAVRATHAALKRAIEQAAAEVHAEVIHAHGVDFGAYLPDNDLPLLATLHLPLSHYPRHALLPARPRTWLNGVSASQMVGGPRGMPRVADVPNGVRLDRFEPTAAPGRRYAIAVGRICPEKGFDVAIDAARLAGVPILVAGRTFPYPAHEAYFAERVAPRLGRGCRFLGGVGPRRMRELLARARCLVVASRVAETSSLASMEALACGTPVVAFRVGALPDIVDHGRTGLVVDDGVAPLAGAIRDVAAIERRACRAAAEDRFDSRQMTRRYLELYERLASLDAGEPMSCSA